MATRRSIRPRLLSIVLLGVITSALSLAALVRILSITTEQRIERAREAVREEVERLARASASGREALAAPPAMAMIGMRGGFGLPPAPTSGLPPAAAGDLPPGWRSLIEDAGGAAQADGRPALAQRKLGAATLVVGARATPSGFAWVGYLLEPPVFLRTWQIIVVLLALATALLVASSSAAVLAFKRSTAVLNASLLALAKDLSTPIPRPRIRELGEIGDGIARLARDLAQSREIQDRLGQELAQKERLAALGRVVAGVAHEVRNPLAAIKLHLDLTAAKHDLPAAAQQAISHASEEISRLDQLVSDLLVVAGRKVGRAEPVPLARLVQSRIDALLPWSATRGVVLDVRGEAIGAIDRESMGRAIDNLLRNAVEASPPQGRVTVEIVERVDGIHLLVDDEGAGVNPERAPELFEPFFTTKPDGTGLGLAISRAIARAHGGDLTYCRLAATTRFDLWVARRSAAPLGERERAA